MLGLIRIMFEGVDLMSVLEFDYDEIDLREIEFVSEVDFYNIRRVGGGTLLGDVGPESMVRLGGESVKVYVDVIVVRDLDDDRLMMYGVLMVKRNRKDYLAKRCVYDEDGVTFVFDVEGEEIEARIRIRNVLIRGE